jgi:hypothetical protein
VHDEVEFMQEWLFNHVSDHCACNYLIQLVTILLDTKYHIVSPRIEETSIDDHSSQLNLRINHLFRCVDSSSKESVQCGKNFIRTLLDHNKEMIFARPGYETLWYYRRALLQISIKMIIFYSTTENQRDQSEGEKNDSTKISQLYQELKQSISNTEELSFVHELLESEIPLLKHTNNSPLLTDLLQMLLYEEFSLLVRCHLEKANWNDTQQRKCSVRCIQVTSVSSRKDYFTPLNK